MSADDKTDLDLDALAALEQAATPGPWERDSGWSATAVAPEGWDGPYVVLETEDRNNAEFLTALRNAAPALIAAARVSRDERRAAEDLADRLDRVAAERGAARAEVAALRERVKAEWFNGNLAEDVHDRLAAALTTGGDQ